VSVVAERESGATFEELSEALETKREKLRERNAKLIELVSEEQVALDDFLRAAPDKNPWTVGTKPQRRHDEVVKVERENANLEKTVETLAGHVAREATLRSVENLRAKTERMQALHKARERLWKQAGKLFEPIVLECWNPFSENAEELQALRREVTPEMLQAVQMLEPEVASAWEQTASEGFQPRDLSVFVEALIELTADPRGEGHRGETTETITRYADHVQPLPGEPRQKRTVVDHESKKYGSRLPKLLPDLRRQVRAVE
jgi:hypothetical protein